MPCLFLRGVPEGTQFIPDECARLYNSIASAAHCLLEDLQVHIENTQYQMLQPDGSTVPAKDVHIVVEWTGRPFEVKEKIADAIDKFFKAHNMQTDLTFRDSGPGTFFVNGKLIGKKPNTSGSELLNL